MAESNTNNQANVSSAKGVKGGYIFSAPVGTELPTDIKTKLDPAFKCLGFLSEDGYVESINEDADDINDMNGDVMDSTNSKRVESAQLTFAEIKAATLKRQYGDNNVTDENGIIAVKHNADSHDVFAYVLDLVLKNNRRWRKVVPKGKSSELDDLTIASSELCQRALTMKYLTDEQGNTCYDYYESTETQAA
nr:MAG TPA: tail protein [Caudoviricetes sp.]